MKKKMKIIFLDFDDIKNPLLGAGQAKATLEVGSRFVKRGHRVTVICSKFPGYKDRKENGIQYRHIGIGTKNIRVNNLLYILLLPFTVRRLKGDIVVECFTAPVSTLYSPLFTKIPVVAIPTSFEAERFAKLYHFPFEAVQNFGLRFYKYFLPYTQFFDKKMKMANKNVRSKVVPEGVGPEFFSIKKQRPEHILFLGRFDVGQKGIDLLLKAYGRIAKKVKYPLVIAGAGPDEEKINKMIKKLKLTEKVTLVGPAYGEKKNDILARSLFVAFSSRHEGFSLFALEALASGLPLVSFDIPGIRWADEDVCVKAKAFNVNDYAKKLLEMSQDPQISQRSQKARKFARKFTWENVVDDYESFMNLIISKQI